MGRVIQGPLAVLQAWNNSATMKHLLELSIAPRVVVEWGDKQRFSETYPHGCSLGFPLGRVKLFCEVLPSTFSIEAARQGRLPSGNYDPRHVFDQRLAFTRAAMGVYHLSPGVGVIMSGRVLIVPQRRKLPMSLREALRGIGVHDHDLGGAATRLQKLQRWYPEG